MAAEQILNSMTMNYFLLAGALAFYGMLIIQYWDRKHKESELPMDRDLRWYEYVYINISVLLVIGLPIALHYVYGDDGGRYMDIGIRIFQFILSVFSIGWIIYRIYNRRDYKVIAND